MKNLTLARSSTLSIDALNVQRASVDSQVVHHFDTAVHFGLKPDLKPKKKGDPRGICPNLQG